MARQLTKLLRCWPIPRLSGCSQKLIQGIDVPGYATIIVLILLLGSVQLFCIGIIGEYVGRTFEQSKDRPIYIAKEVLDYEQN